MENFRKHLPVTLRIVVSFLFLLSAVAKLYPSPYFAISTFEVKQLYPMGFSEGLAVYFSRILIGAELALGILLLQRHHLKKVVVPATILMLVVFILHLTLDTIQNGGNSGNCGCFGSLLPMTPIEAIIKNVIAVALLVWLYRLLPHNSDKKNGWVIASVVLAAVLSVFMLAPIQPASSAIITPDETVVPVAEPAAIESIDTVSAATEVPSAEPTVTEPEITTTVNNAPAAVKSIYSGYFANADKGKKIIALFAPGCEHCRGVAKELTEMRAKDKNFPEVNIIFMDEEADLIPEFFKQAGAEYPHKVLDIISFWKLLGNTKDTPGIVYQWNGNKIAEWDGINDKKFVAAEFLKAYKKPYTPKGR